MTIPLLDLTAQYRSIQGEIDGAIQRVVASGHFILGEEVSALESEIAGYLGVPHAVGVASGTDALVIALRALEIGEGDEVIVPAYTFFASAGAVLSVGARPVFVDIDPVTYGLDPAKIEAAMTSRTRAIMPVHLYGHPAEMDTIAAIARAHGLRIIEDNAQAFGAEYKGRKTGAMGDIGCLSFFPSKNLGAYGDAGMAVTADPALAEKMRMLRAHGWKKKYFPEMLGYNSRLDALQAAILRVKLPHVDEWNARRREIAMIYGELLGAADPAQGSAQGRGAGSHGGRVLAVPVEQAGCRHVYHQYVVRLAGRDAVQAALKAAGIGSDIYYPQPPYLAGPCQALGYQAGDFPEADRASRETLAIPIYPEMTREMATAVAAAIGRG